MQQLLSNIKQKILRIDKLHWFLITAVAVLSILICWVISTPKPNFDDGFRKAQIENLEQQKKQATDSIAALKKLMVQKDSNDNRLKNQYKQNENKIKVIHSIIAIKDSVINSSNVDELQQFLSDNGKDTN